MVNSPNNTSKMEIYDDRPISMYDNLNNMTANMNTTTAMNNNNTSTPKVTKVPTTMTTSTAKATTETATATMPTSSKTNGAAHSTPFADITFKFNENQNMQQQPINGNRNLNQIQPNAGNNAAVYATPYKTAAKPVTNTASPPPPLIQSAQQQQQQLQQTPPPVLPLNTLTSSSLLHTANPTIAVIATPTAALQSDTFNSSYNNRPLSQHSQSELNETSHSIAAVKAALNEAKSKFFGLNGYAPQQPLQQQQQHYEDDNDDDESHNHNLLSSLAPKIQQVQNTKPQPKYQNIPENSAIFRNQSAGLDSGGVDCGDGGVSAPELPPKPVEYQNFYKQPPTTKNNNIATPENIRKMPAATSYNQISLNDIDSAASRSQTVYMATTVPQNIKGNKIAGRHTPTRTSLRHSRMLVVNNKNYEEVQHANPMGFQQPNLARWLLILQIIIGILLLSLSIWIVFLTPNAPIQDNPYWCGLVLLITGIIGLIVIRYRRIKRAKMREHCFMFLRMDSYVLSLLSVLLCCVALIFAAIHYCRLTASDTKCKSMNLLLEHGSCVCTFNAPLTGAANTTEPLLNGLAEAEGEDIAEQFEDNSYNVEYRDLSCQEVTGPWTSILGLSFILNCLGFLISLSYIVLLACCRKSSKRFYTTVHTSTF